MINEYIDYSSHTIVFWNWACYVNVLNQHPFEYYSIFSHTFFLSVDVSDQKFER